MVHFVNFHFMCMGELTSAGQITRGLQTGLVFTGLARTEWANGDMDMDMFGDKSSMTLKCGIAECH